MWRCRLQGIRTLHGRSSVVRVFFFKNGASQRDAGVHVQVETTRVNTLTPFQKGCVITSAVVPDDRLSFISQEPALFEQTPCFTGANPRRPAALTVLRKFLSPANMRSPTPRMHTANTLKSLYTVVRAQRQLGKLGSDRMSRLISLLGILSLPDHDHPKFFSNPLAAAMRTQPSRTHWVFVLMVVNDLHRMNKVLDHSSRYWAMRAELAKTHNVSELNTSVISKAMDRARAHYAGFHPIIAHPDIRLPYLQSLLSLFPEYGTELIDRFCDLLRCQRSIHPRLVTLLWEIILKHGVDMPMNLKVKLLSGLRHRLIAQLRLIRNLPPTKRATSKPGSIDTIPFKIAEYAHILTSTFFRRDYLYPQHVHHWALHHGLAVFGSHNPMEVQWGHLILLATFNSSPISDRTHLEIPPYSRKDHSYAAWRLVFSLATLEKVFGGESMRVAEHQHASLKDIVRNLWNMWVESTKSHDHPGFVHRTILGSFLRLSGLLLDTSLKDGCFQLISSRRLWTASDLKQRDVSQIQQLMVEHLVAFVLCGQRDWNKLCSFTDHLLPHWWSEITVLLISRLIDHDPQVAHQFFLYCGVVGRVAVPSSDILSLGTALASQGAFRPVMAILQDTRLSKPHAHNLTAMILRNMKRYRIQRIERDIASVLADAVQQAFPSRSQPPPSLRHAIQHALLVLARSYQSAKAVTIFEAIHQLLPKYFKTRWISIFLHRLLLSKQFRLATRVYSTLRKSNPPHATKLHATLITGLAKGGASSLARKLSRENDHNSGGRSRIERSVRALNFQMKPPSPVLSLKAVAMLTRRPLDGSSVRLAMLILVRTYRLSAAMMLFERSRNELDAETRTRVGNIILNGVMLRRSLRNRQGMRKVLYTLDGLVKQGFVPDRVTANIIIKALMRWGTKIDSSKLRALFDKMVSAGYQPIKPVYERSPSIEKSATISFERHIRPLYKMFIRAFYLRGDFRAVNTVVSYLKARDS